MIKTSWPAKLAVAEIVLSYRQIQGDEGRLLSLREFAEKLTAIVAPYGGSISHQTVKNWQDKTNLPNRFFLIQIHAHAPTDWRRDFAQDVLAVIIPDQYSPATETGKRAISNGEMHTFPPGNKLVP